MPRFKCLPYRPPSPEEQPKAGPGEDEKTRRTREPDFPTRATRVYASVEEAERARGHLPEVYGTSEWADQFHFPRRTQPVGRGRFTLPTAHDSAPRPGGSFGAHALGKNEKRQSITKKKPKKTKRAPGGEVGSHPRRRRYARDHRRLVFVLVRGRRRSSRAHGQRRKRLLGGGF